MVMELANWLAIALGRVRVGRRCSLLAGNRLIDQIAGIHRVKEESGADDGRMDHECRFVTHAFHACGSEHLI